MIRITSIQNGHRLEITVDQDVPDEARVLDDIIGTLSRSRIASHRAIARQIENQRASTMTLVRFSLDITAVRRVEGSLRHRLSVRNAYANAAQRELHDKLCRALGLHPERVREGVTVAR